MVKCAECGSEVGAGEQFCGNCGAPVEATEASPLEEADVLTSGETILAEAPVLPDPEPAPVASEPEFAPPPPPPPLAPEDGGSKKKTWIIVAIVAAVLLLCCCCIGAIVIILSSEDVMYEIENVIEDLAMVAPSVIQVVLA